MLLELYLLFWITAIVGMIFCFFLRVYKKETFLLLPFLTMAFFFFIGLMSYSIEIPFCNLKSNDEFVCYSFIFEDSGLSFLAYGLGIIMLLYAIYTSITSVAEVLK